MRNAEHGIKRGSLRKRRRGVCPRHVLWPRSDVAPATARAGRSRRDVSATIRLRGWQVRNGQVNGKMFAYVRVCSRMFA